MSQIPHQLIQQIKAGNVVLFLGAGASHGALNSSNEKIPNGKGLSKALSQKFLGENIDNEEDLAYISELCISESSLFEVQQYIAHIFKDFKPSNHHFKIPKFVWKAIFTTNYDLIIESSYQKTEKPFQELVSVTKDTPKTQIFYKDNVLPYYKIHGCINDINDKDAPLILTPDQFANYSQKRERLFIELQELLFDYTFIFVGFGMADTDIRYVLNRLEKNNSNRVRSYMIGPYINDMQVRLWEGKKITPIKMPFSDFLDEIENQIDLNSRQLSSIKFKEDSPIYRTFQVSTDLLQPTENFLDFITNNIDYVHSNISSPNTDPTQFYKGFFNNWDPILKNLDVNRQIKDGIIFEVFIDNDRHTSNEQLLYLLRGNAGSGKSVLLKRIAYDASTIAERFCIFLKDGYTIKPEHLVELSNYVKDRIYLFIDNISLIADEVINLIKKAKRENIRLTIIGAERLNVWNTECQDLANLLTHSYHIQYLSDDEIKELIGLLDRHNALYTLKSKTDEERIRAFAEKAGRELLVALYEATNSKPFEEIIYDEYKSINNAKAQSLYLTVSIFHKIGAYARAGFISRVHNISFHDFKEQLFKPLEYIVFDRRNYQINDFIYLTRNRMIAEIIFEKVLNTVQDRYDEYIRILNNLNIDYDSDRQAFLSIVNAKKLIEIFPDPHMIRNLYSISQKISHNDPKLFQQQAIFEMTSTGGSLHSAERHLKAAYEIKSDDPFISHTLAELNLKKAENAKIDSEFYHYINEAVEICNSIIKKKDVSYPHPYHTNLKAQILKLKKVLGNNDSPSIERCIKDIEKIFSTAKQQFSDDQFILEIESKFNEIINENNNAKDLLELAFKSNKSSPFIALRLANFFEREGFLDNAISTLKDALAFNPNDKDLNYKFAMFLEKKLPSDFDDIKYHLRRAFTKGDNRSQAQFWYGRAQYITGELTEAKDTFKALSQVSIAPNIKNAIHGIIKENNKAVTFSGTIIKIEYSFGFVRRDEYGDEIFFYRYENENIDWNELRRGERVTFFLGFNYKGPTAINIRLQR